MAERALRRTPCIGVCSTTYGDLVCRGCKRFAHEIVCWNAYDIEQTAAVRRRLATLRDDSMAMFAQVADAALLRRCAAAAGVAAASLSELGVAYETLRRARGGRPVAALGLRSQPHVADLDAAGLFVAVDREYYARALAFYERSFRIRAE